jgi:hypothetical protein
VVDLCAFAGNIGYVTSGGCVANMCGIQIFRGSGMHIEFKIGDANAAFSRNWFTGKALLDVDGQIIQLQSSWNPTTHYSTHLNRSWQVGVGSDEVVIEKIRPLLLAGFRPHSYRILLDGELIVEQAGY